MVETSLKRSPFEPQRKFLWLSIQAFPWNYSYLYTRKTKTLTAFVAVQVSRPAWELCKVLIEDKSMLELI